MWCCRTKGWRATAFSIQIRLKRGIANGQHDLDFSLDVFSLVTFSLRSATGHSSPRGRSRFLHSSRRSSVVASISLAFRSPLELRWMCLLTPYESSKLLSKCSEHFQLVLASLYSDRRRSCEPYLRLTTPHSLANLLSLLLNRLRLARYGYKEDRRCTHQGRTNAWLKLELRLD